MCKNVFFDISFKKNISNVKLAAGFNWLNSWQEKYLPENAFQVFEKEVCYHVTYAFPSLGYSKYAKYHIPGRCFFFWFSFDKAIFKLSIQNILQTYFHGISQKKKEKNRLLKNVIGIHLYCRCKNLDSAKNAYLFSNNFEIACLMTCDLTFCENHHERSQISIWAKKLPKIVIFVKNTDWKASLNRIIAKKTTCILKFVLTSA